MKSRIQAVGFFIVLLVGLAACGETHSQSGGGSDTPDEPDASELRAELNDSLRSIWERNCACYEDALTEDPSVDCVDAYFEPLAQSECELAATQCYVSDFEAFVDCNTAAFNDYNRCIAQCPVDPEFTTCVDALESATTRCETAVSDELVAAFDECETSAMPACASDSMGGGNDPDPQPTFEECRQDFVQNVVAPRNWTESFAATYDGISGGELVSTCKCGEPCAVVTLMLYEDGTYFRQWLQDNSYCAYNSQFGGIDSSGTWEFTGCGQFRLNDCLGDTLDVQYEMDGDFMRTRMPWRMEGHLLDLTFKLERDGDPCCSQSITSSQCD